MPNIAHKSVTTGNHKAEDSKGQLRSQKCVSKVFTEKQAGTQIGTQEDKIKRNEAKARSKRKPGRLGTTKNGWSTCHSVRKRNWLRGKGVFD